MSGFAVLVDERDFTRAALDHMLRLERKGGSRRRLGRNLVGNLGKQQDETEDCGKNRYSFHGDTVSGARFRANPEVTGSRFAAAGWLNLRGEPASRVSPRSCPHKRKFAACTTGGPLRPAHGDSR